MTATQTSAELTTIDLIRETLIDAPVDIAFEAAIAELGPEGTLPDGSSMQMKIEAWPGGRWYRDLGEGRGHLWGHVQVIKPPSLIEICGPMFMSYPAVNFLQYRLTEEGPKTRLKLTHKAFGQIPDEHREGVSMGWEEALEMVKRIAARMVSER